MKRHPWIKSVLILLVIFLLGLVVPDKEIDPWKVINLNKIIDLIFGLSAVHFVSQVLVRKIGHREGLFVSGFLGGIVSSTAITIKLAKESKKLGPKQTINKSVLFLSSTLAMLVEALVFICIWAKPLDYKIFIILLGPFLMTGVLIYFWHRKSTHTKVEEDKSDSDLGLSSSVKLALFIALVSSLSKLFNKSFGSIGLTLVTGVVSLFEVHGSIISNVQLFSDKTISLPLLGTLLGVSLTASYFSKILIVLALGSSTMKKTISIWSSLMVMSIALSIVLYNYLT